MGGQHRQATDRLMEVRLAIAIPRVSFGPWGWSQGRLRRWPSPDAGCPCSLWPSPIEGNRVFSQPRLIADAETVGARRNPGADPAAAPQRESGLAHWRIPQGAIALILALIRSHPNRRMRRRTDAGSPFAASGRGASGSASWVWRRAAQVNRENRQRHERKAANASHAIRSNSRGTRSASSSGAVMRSLTTRRSRPCLFAW